MNKRLIITVGLLIFTIAILAASLRGLPGSPTNLELNNEQWKTTGPFESSGRYALTYSLVEDRSFQFSLPVARFATPDLAISDGHYVSLFPPGLSFILIPGYLLGKAVGASQIGAFATISLFALLNVILVRSIAIRLGAHPLAAAVGALAFLFASPAFSYAVSMSQHHVSTFFILMSVYVLLRWHSLWSISLIWLLWAVAITVDNPNFFLMLPVGIAAMGKIFSVQWNKRGLHMTVRTFGVVTFLIVILPISFYLWVNQMSYGDPLQLAGTLPRVLAIDVDGAPATPDVYPVSSSVRVHDPNREKTAIGLFATRNMLNGFYIHALSPDRGVLWFAPVVLIGVIGLVIATRAKAKVGALFVAIVGVNVILYSMFSDPWGGWSFGSRYLIPAYALLSVGLAVALSRWRAKYVLLLIFLAVFSYSAWVNTLGAITSNLNPPKVEVLALEELTGQEQKYTFARNWDYLMSNGSKSFVWQTFAREHVSALTYHRLLTGAIVAVALALISGLALSRQDIGKETL